MEELHILQYESFLCFDAIYNCILLISKLIRVQIIFTGAEVVVL